MVQWLRALVLPQDLGFDSHSHITTHNCLKPRTLVASLATSIQAKHPHTEKKKTSSSYCELGEDGLQ